MEIKILRQKSNKLPIINSIFVKWDGYNEDLYNRLMRFDGAIYDKKSSSIEISDIWLEDVKKVCDKYGNTTVTDNVKSDTNKPTNNIPSKYKFKVKPYQHQIDGIKFGLNHDKWLLLDDQGLGKTAQIIELADILKIKHCLIICGVNSLKYNWAEEIKKFSNLNYNILDEGLSKSGKITKLSVGDSIAKLKSNIPETFVITNREKLADKNFLKAFNSSKTKFDMIVVDECHKFKNPNSKSGKTLLKLNAPHMIALSGTMIMNSPEDSYVPLKWTGQIGSNFSQFKSYYNVYGGFANKEVVGHKNLEQLQSLIDTCSLRRMKTDVLDLPPKNFIDEYVDLTVNQKKLYEDVKAGILSELDKIETPKIGFLQELSLCVRLRQITACPDMLSTEITESAKIDRAKDIVEQAVSQGDKVVIFSTFKQTVYKLAKELKQYGVVIATGDQSDIEINEAKEQFNYPDVNVFIATWQKMGTGHTLTQASYMIFIDTPWTQADINQVSDRIYRIGQTKPCFIYTLIAKDTYDIRVKKITEYKGKLSDYLIDKQELTEFLK